MSGFKRRRNGGAKDRYKNGIGGSAARAFSFPTKTLHRIDLSGYDQIDTEDRIRRLLNTADAVEKRRKPV